MTKKHNQTLFNLVSKHDVVASGQTVSHMLDHRPKKQKVLQRLNVPKYGKMSDNQTNF